MVASDANNNFQRADSGYDIRVNTAGTFFSVPYVYYVNAYNAEGVRQSVTFYNAADDSVASETFTSNGGFSTTLGGNLYEQKTVEADDSYEIRLYAPGNFEGVGYASYQNAYNAEGVHQSVTFYNAADDVVASETIQPNGGFAITLNGELYDQKTVQADNSYDIRLYAPGTFEGVGYASHDYGYNAAGVRQSVTFYNSADDAVASETFEPNGGFAITLGGELYDQKTVEADDSYDIRLYAPGTFEGVGYASYQNAYNAAGVHQSVTFYNAADDVVASETIQPNGGFTITLGGELYDQKTVQADNSYDIRRYAPGTFDGIGYASYDYAYNAEGVRQSVTFYDAAGDDLASETFGSNGGFTITLNSGYLADVTAAWLNGLSPAVVAALTAADLAAIPATAFSGVTVAFAQNISVSAISGLSATQIAAFSPAVLSALSAAQLAGLMKPQITSLTAAELGNFNPAFWSSQAWLSVAATWLQDLPSTVLPSLPLAAFHTLTGSAVGRLDETVWTSLDADQLNALTPSAWGGVSGQLIFGMTAAVIGQLSAASLQAISVQAITSLSISALSAPQAGELTSAQLDNLTSQQVSALSAKQVTAISGANPSGFWSNVSGDWLGSLSAGGIGGLTPSAFVDVPVSTIIQLPDNTILTQYLPAAVVAGLTPYQIAAFNGGALLGLNIRYLTAAQIGEFSEQQLQQLTSTQWAALDFAQVAAITDVYPGFWMTIQNDQLSAISESAVAGIGTSGLLSLHSSFLTADQLAGITYGLPGFWSSVPARWFNNLSASALAGLPGSALPQLPLATVALLTSATFNALPTLDWEEFTPAQIAVLTPTQFNDDFIENPSVIADILYPWALNVAVIAELTAPVVSEIPPTEFAGLDAIWLNDLPAGALSSLSAAQIQAILPQYFPYLSSANIGSLTSTEAGYLTPTQVEGFTAADFQALSGAAAQALPDDDLSGLTTNQLTGVTVEALFTSSQIMASAALETEMVQGWTTAQIESFGIANLSALQIQALTPSQLYDLRPEDIDNFSTSQLLEMNGRQLATLYNFLPYNPAADFDAQAVIATPTAIVQLASSWNASNYGDETLGYASIWPDLTNQQVVALANAGDIASNLGGAASAADAANTFADLQELPDAVFAALGQGSNATNTLVALIHESYTLDEALTTGEVDSIAPSVWQSALNNSSAPAVAYFENYAPPTTWFIYYLNQNDPNWLGDGGLQHASVDQLGQISPTQVQGQSVAALYALSAAQYAAIYGNLSSAQVEGLLFQEIGGLPAAAQTSFFNSGDLTGDIQTLLNPGETSGQLFSGAFTTNDQIAAQNFITIYDQNYGQIAANPNQFKEFSAFYNLLETRSNTLIADSTISAQITADVNSMLNDFTLYDDALTPSATPSNGMSDVTSYVEGIASSLDSAEGGLTALESDLTALGAIENNVAGLVLDNTTEATPIGALLQWALNGSPNAITPVGQGNLTYAGQAGLTFSQALERVENSLFTNADNFVKNDETGIASVVANQTAQQQTQIIGDVLDIVGAIASFGEGVGEVLNAFSSTFGASALTGLVGSGFVSRLANASTAADAAVATGESLWKDFDSSSSDGTYSNLASAGGYVGSLVNNLTSLLTSGDATAAAAINEANQFAADYNTLVTTIDQKLSQNVTTLGVQTLSTPGLYDAVANNTGYYNFGWVAPSDADSEYSTAANLPTNDAMTFMDSQGLTHVVDLNLANIFGNIASDVDIGVTGNIPPPPDVKLKDKYSNSNSLSTLAYWDLTAPGPDLPGYASTEVDMRVQISGADGNPQSMPTPFANNVWNVVGVNLIGNAPL